MDGRLGPNFDPFRDGPSLLGNAMDGINKQEKEDE